MKRQLARTNKNKYMLSTAILLLAMVPGVYAVGTSASPSVYASITRDALGGTLADANLKAVIDADESQETPGGEGKSEKRRHFDGTAMPAAVSYINREKTRALTLAAEADTDAESRADALRHLGLMLHSVQDFYLHTNYVELQLEEPGHKNDPYNIPLVDWTRVPDGYTSMKTGKKLAGYDAANPEFDILNKEGSNSTGGKLVVTGKASQFSVARELAVRETQRQWNLFETLVHNRCGGRATAVLTALRKADPKPARGEAHSADGGY